MRSRLINTFGPTRSGCIIELSQLLLSIFLCATYVSLTIFHAYMGCPNEDQLTNTTSQNSNSRSLDFLIIFIPSREHQNWPTSRNNTLEKSCCRLHPQITIHFRPLWIQKGKRFNPSLGSPPFNLRIKESISKTNWNTPNNCPDNQKQPYHRWTQEIF